MLSGEKMDHIKCSIKAREHRERIKDKKEPKNKGNEQKIVTNMGKY